MSNYQKYIYINQYRGEEEIQTIDIYNQRRIVVLRI